MRLAEVVETSERVGGASRRLEKIALLAALLGRLRPEEVEPAVAWLSGRARQGRIGVGWATLRAAGVPSAECAVLEVIEVDRALDAMAAVRGPGADAERRTRVQGLFTRATAAEQRFLTGLLLGEIRQGALAGVMLEAVARAAGVDAGAVRRAVMAAGDLGVVARAVLASGASGLDAFEIRLFQPVHPMLADSAEDIGEALNRFGEAALEYKIDGARVQVHRSGDEVRVYSRKLNDVTAAVPEIVEAVRMLPADGLILDGEVLSVTPAGRPQPFQVTMRRFGRKLDVDRMRHELPIRPFWFDLLFLEGMSLVNEPQARRFALLESVASPGSLIPAVLASDRRRAEDFVREALAEGHEGVMAKDAAAAYTAGRRGSGWLKIKQPRTLDLVVLAAEWGHGRRRGWLSNLHLGAPDPGKGFAMLGKTFKGLTDAMLAWQTGELLKREIAREEYTVHVRPELVVEVAFNQIQVSTRYPSGLALRFARVKRYRPDKSAEDADTFETVRKMAEIS